MEGAGRGVREEGGQEVQTCTYKRSKCEGCNGEHDGYHYCRLHRKVVERVNPKGFHFKENFFPFFFPSFFFLYCIYEWGPPPKKIITFWRVGSL